MECVVRTMIHVRDLRIMIDFVQDALGSRPPIQFILQIVFRKVTAATERLSGKREMLTPMWAVITCGTPGQPVNLTSYSFNPDINNPEYRY